VNVDGRLSIPLPGEGYNLRDEEIDLFYFFVNRENDITKLVGVIIAEDWELLR
jgi:hypothetical protein